MKRQQWIAALCALGIVAGTALVLGWLRTHQKLGAAGVKTRPIPGQIKCVVELPEKVLDYESRWIETDPIATNALPADTSFGQRIYTATNRFPVAVNVVLMGTDRTSMHKPQFCLVGGGWHIDQTASTTIAMERPVHYTLPVTKLMVSRQEVQDNQPTTWRGIYVYWYVTDRMLSGDASGFQRLWSMAKELLRSGTLQRWAYVTCFVVCQPGQEAAAYEQLQQFMNAAVPEFQLTPAAGDAAAGSRR